ncbi:hypothetical protein Nepgr_023377 [Nepenthes gracilis]|uniref:Protein translocase subunit SecA n=1 Tax=Nepenthes gracilis TaxID=150966 RepID=A0AAD3T2B6_NEPGR|nr:hypothetical protein Nepgr_023377 [Nepenthes gracilis]
MVTTLAEPAPSVAVVSKYSAALFSPLTLPKKQKTSRPYFMGLDKRKYKLRFGAGAGGVDGDICGRRKGRVVASLGGLLSSIFKGADDGEATRQQYASTVSLISNLEPQFLSLSDSELRERTTILRQRAQNGESLDALLPVLNPLWQYEFANGIIFLDNTRGLKLEDGITNGSEEIFHSLRYLHAQVADKDLEMVPALSVDELVLRSSNYCIIDEVDSILIDEARTPLIISGPADKPSDRYYKAAKIAAAFERDIHYTVDEKQKAVLLTEQGYVDSEEILDVKDLYDPREQWALYILNAIKAKELFLRDVNYIVRGKEVLIVDEFTGRIMQGRRWSDGLHQAVEAKECLPIQNETITLASISYQNFFLQFPKLCGMTGTAATESTEFESIYKLKVTIIPTNKPMIRKDESDVVFRATTGKWQAVVVEISRMHKMGRPVLVGTTSVEQSDSLSEQLLEVGIPHEVLNAKPENVEREAEIVAQSGRLGAVTIATNMAGRGTDIILGGNAEFMARLKLREMLMPRYSGGFNEFFVRNLLKFDLIIISQLVIHPNVSKDRIHYLNLLFKYKVYTEEERNKVVSYGGLHVIGTERHESRRIDNQLRGRSGRQGDPGSSRFFLSLEDNIFRIFGGDRIKGLMRAFRVEDLPIESKILTKALDEAQRKVENYFFDIRKQLFEYDEVLNSQRDRVYMERRRALESNSLESLLIEYAELTMDDILEANIGPDAPKESWNLEKLIAKLQQYCYLLNDLTPELLANKCSTYDDLRDYLRTRGREVYLQKRAIVEKAAPGLMKEAERFLILSNIDRLWKEHLQALKFVQQAVGLRGYAQRDPLIEYKLEGYSLFLEMMAQIRRNVIYSVYQFQPVRVRDKQQQQDKSSRIVANGSSTDENPNFKENRVLAEDKEETR